MIEGGFVKKFIWNKRDKNEMTTRSFFPSGAWTLANWQACCLDWCMLGIACLLVYVRPFLFIPAFLCGWLLARLEERKAV